MAEVSRIKRLAAYLSIAARKPINYAAGWDCAAGFVAGWVEQERGVDGATPWRGRYRTALGCQRILKREGGLVGVVGRGAAIVGLAPVTDPVAGDIGVVRAQTAAGEGEVSAIKTRVGWALLSPTGLIVAPASVLAAWRV